MEWEQTCKLIPEGVQTLSKRPCCHVEGYYPNWLVRGEGAYVFDEAGKKYLDYPCSLGTVILGHGFKPVVDTVKKQLDEGTLFSLSHPKETELAELIRNVIPSIEMMRFVKTGSEACSAAVKIARAYTGRAPIICCGYHGWHDWYNCTTPKNAGAIAQDVTPATWGDERKLAELFEAKKPAAFILEPYVYEDEKAIEKWLKEVRRLCDIHKVVLIFDENVTGFRTRKLAAQNYWKVKPDLTCLGKAMANGIPMACVGGKKEIMEVLTKDCFVSSTFGGDLLGISAAIATITYLSEHPIVEHIWTMGSKLKSTFNQLATSFMLEGVKCIGLPPRTHFIFPTAAHKGLFWQECLKEGIYFGHAQFVSGALTLPDMDKTSAAMRQGLKMVMKHYEKPEEVLLGKPPVETLRLVTVPAPQTLTPSTDVGTTGFRVAQPVPIIEPDKETTDEVSKPIPVVEKSVVFEPGCADAARMTIDAVREKSVKRGPGRPRKVIE